MRPAVPPAPVAASPEQALVVFLRPVNYGRQEMVTVIDDRRHFIGQPNGRQCWMLLVPPGQYGFLALGENTDSVRATVEAGRVYFVMVQIGMGMWAPRAHITALTSRDERWERLAQYVRESQQMRVDLTGGDASLDPPRCDAGSRPLRSRGIAIRRRNRPRGSSRRRTASLRCPDRERLCGDERAEP